VSSLFFNSSNPAEDPDLYLDQLNHLLDKYFEIRKLHELESGAGSRKPKLVVNTCGWVEGLGAHLISSLATSLSHIPATQFISLKS